jgi:hypothetical protein
MERMTGIRIGSDAPRELIFYDKDGRVFPKIKKATKPRSGASRRKAKKAKVKK